MTTHRTHCAACGLLTVMLGAGGEGRADHGSGPTLFVDDFTDGDATDGAPVAWDPLAIFPGSYDASSGDYVLTPPPGGAVAGQLVAIARNVVADDVSIRMQVRKSQRIASPTGSIGVLARMNPVDPDADGDDYTFYEASIRLDGELRIHRKGGAGSGIGLIDVPTGLNAADDDLLLQFDLLGDSLRVWAWRAEDPMPDVPQIDIVDQAYTSGGIALWSNDGANQDDVAIFRFVDVSQAIAPPELIRVCPTVGDAAHQDRYFDPAGPSAGGLTEIEVEMSEPVVLTGPICVKSTGSSPPASADWTEIGVSGPNVYAVLFSAPLELGIWTTCTMAVESAAGVPADICFHVGWQPGDGNQDGATSLADANAFGIQFQGQKNPKLADFNGDGQVSLADASTFGQIMHGTGGEEHPDGGGWAGTGLPDNDGNVFNGRTPPACVCP